jgi:hypothetical protein
VDGRIEAIPDGNPERPIKQFDRGLKRRHLGSREIEFS